MLQVPRFVKLAPLFREVFPIMLVTQSCPTLCDPMDCSPPGSSVLGILQARILEWIAMHFFRGSSQPGIEPTPLISLALAGGFFTTSTT